MLKYRETFTDTSRSMMTWSYMEKVCMKEVHTLLAAVFVLIMMTNFATCGCNNALINT